MRTLTWLLITLLAVACGALDTPDLRSGRVVGHLSGATPGAYVYVYGAPDRFAWVGTDGSFRIDQVAAGQTQVILFDGDQGAKQVQANVGGARVEQLEEQAPLPAAGRIVAGAVPTGGCVANGARFDVVGTILSQVQATGGAAVELYPLPTGTYRVRVTLAGFAATEKDLGAAAGQGTPEEIELEVGGDEKGCVASGCATPGLTCEPEDGWCYPCVEDEQCGSNGQCVHDACIYPGGGGAFCDACTNASECQGGFCAGGDSGTGTCTSTCSSAADCPAGADCQDVGGTQVCVAPKTCSAFRYTFGASCFSAGRCQGAIAGSSCAREGSEDSPGVCTATCDAKRTCPASFTCDSGRKLCVPE